MRTILFALAIAAAAPAFAAPETCATAPAALRAAAATAAPDAQRRAMNDVIVGERLCDAGNRFEGARKFRDAAKSLGTDLAAVMASTKTADLAQ